MERWCGKIAVITGASSGIGASIAIELVKQGIRVIGLARRIERVEALKTQLPESKQSELRAFKCDVTSEDDIKNAFKWIELNFGVIHILINNAGIGVTGMNILDDDNTDKLKGIIDTNLLGPALCTRETFRIMKKNNVIDGHVIMINSYLGHNIPFLPFNQSLNIYPSTKFAVTAMTEVLRQEFQLFQTKIKITVSFNIIHI